MDLYFQGAACWHKGAGNPENMRTARGFFEEALALDPTNVEALVGKAWIDTFVAAAVMSDERAARIAAAESGIGQALALAPNHAFAHFVLSWIYTVTGRGAQGIAEAERSATLDRNLASAHYAIGFAKTVLGRPEETEAHVLEALRLSPHDSLAHAWMAVAAYGKLALEQYEAAEVWVRRSIEANRTVPLMYFFMAATLALQSKLEEATAAAKQGLALDPRFTLSRMRGAFAGDPTAPYRVRLVEGLRLAGVPEG
jgi:tetratricopeptide (TPR) repeat protein